MSIVLVSTAVNLGGAERYMFELALWLAESGDDVVLLVSEEIGQVSALALAGTKVRVNTAAIGWSYGSEDNTAGTAYAAKIAVQNAAMRKALGQFRNPPRILLFNANWPTHYIGAMQAAVDMHIGFAVHFHLCPHRLFLNPLAADAHDLALRAAQFLSCVSRNNRFFLQRTFGPDFDFRVILNGSRFELTDASREELLSAERDNTFLLVGRLEHQKGLIDILPALSRLHTRSEVEVHVLGDGPLLSLLEQTLPSSGAAVRMIGNVDNMQERMSRATAMLLPSHFEGLSLSILEALSVGCIPIVSRASSASEIIEDGRNGFLFDVADWRSMLRAMDRFAASDQRTIRRRCIETSRRFSRSAMFEGMSKAIRG